MLVRNLTRLVAARRVSQASGDLDKILPLLAPPRSTPCRLMPSYIADRVYVARMFHFRLFWNGRKRMENS